MSEEPERFDRTYALMKFTKDELTAWLSEFFGINDTDGTYAYWLTRVKAGFHHDTVTLDDYVEFDDETVDQLAEHILKKLKVE